MALLCPWMHGSFVCIVLCHMYIFMCSCDSPSYACTVFLFTCALSHVAVTGVWVAYFSFPLSWDLSTCSCGWVYPVFPAWTRPEHGWWPHLMIILDINWAHFRFHTSNDGWHAQHSTASLVSVVSTCHFCCRLNDCVMRMRMMTTLNSNGDSHWNGFFSPDLGSKKFIVVVQVDSAYNVPRYNVLFGYEVLFSFVPRTYVHYLCTYFRYKVPFFLLSRGVDLRYIPGVDQGVVNKLFIYDSLE